MAKKSSDITITDQFCGAGGSGQGARKALKEVGGRLLVGLNHWKLATETYSTNNPNTIVDCTDVSACDPRRYPSTNGLITSPECTTHSPGGGNTHKSLKMQMDMFKTGKIDPATERSRATMWDVCRFTEYHGYEFIIVENVVEAKTRWPLFDTWLMAMHTLGYQHKCVYRNSMHHHPTPQSRDRIYVVFWKKGNKAPDLDFYPAAFCNKCMKDINSVQTWKRADIQYGKYKRQYVYCCPNCSTVVEPYYYASFNCIDWSDIGTRIGDRIKPIAEKTRLRAQYGLDKYSTPFIVNEQQTTGVNFRVKGIQEIIPTVNTSHSLKLYCPPFIIKGEHSKSDPQIKSVFDNLQTQVTRQTMSLVTPPFLVEMHSNGSVRKTTDPLNGITTSGAKNGIISTDSWNSFIASYYGGSSCTTHITDSLGTLTTKDRHALFTYKKPEVEDCYFRMLKPIEVKLGMAFDPDYTILGSGKDQVKQCGNAVTPPVMEDLVRRCINSLN